jgi:hypothetical protein
LKNIGSITAEKILAKSLRPFLTSRISKKRISQLFFQKMVFELSSQWGEDKITYVESSDLTKYLGLVGLPPKVLVSGGTDHDITELEYNIMKSASKTIFYVQNLDFPETTNIYTLPIGIEDLRWGRNGMPWNFSRSKKLRRKIEMTLVGPFAATHPSRQECVLAAKGSSFAQLEVSRLASWRYAKLASRFMFVACPRGNGLDTHRFWETLYRGSIPVVLESPHVRNLEKYSLPLLKIASWESLDESLRKFVSEGIELKTEHSMLNPNWWVQRFTNDIMTA